MRKAPSEAHIDLPYCSLCRLGKAERNELATMIWRRVPVRQIGKRFEVDSSVVVKHSNICIPSLLDRVTQNERAYDVRQLTEIIAKENVAMESILDATMAAADAGNLPAALASGKGFMDRLDHRIRLIEKMDRNRDRAAAEAIRTLAAKIVLLSPIEGSAFVASILQWHPTLGAIMEELNNGNDHDTT